MNSEFHSAMLIAVMSGVTILLRFLPFGIFNGKRDVPGVIMYLGDVLPGAVIGMLVIYCLKDISFAGAPYGLHELSACAAVVIVQLWKRNSLLSIVTGTVIFMLIS